MDYEKLTEREIDALVAEKVMGVKWPSNRCRICGWLLKNLMVDGCTEDSCSMRPVPNRRSDDPAAFTTDANCRDQVVEKMRELGWRGSLAWWHGRDCFLYRGEFWKEVPDEDLEEDAICHIDTLPGRAVAIAALKAYEVKQS